MTTPAELSFAVLWQNWALQNLFNFNRDVCFEVFKQVWDTAIEEAAATAQEVSHIASARIKELK
jgi:hypothetical protein